MMHIRRTANGNTNVFCSSKCSLVPNENLRSLALVNTGFFENSNVHTLPKENKDAHFEDEEIELVEDDDDA